MTKGYPFYPEVTALHISFASIKAEVTDTDIHIEKALDYLIGNTDIYEPYMDIVYNFITYSRNKLLQDPTVTAYTMLIDTLARKPESPTFNGLKRANAFYQEELDERILFYQKEKVKGYEEEALCIKHIEEKQLSAEIFQAQPKLSPEYFFKLCTLAEKTDTLLLKMRPPIMAP